jgi:hypothetical protein
MGMPVFPCGSAGHKMHMLMVAHMDSRTSENPDIVKMVKEVRAGFDFMDMTSVVRNGLPRYPRKAVVMRIVTAFGYVGTAGEFMDVPLVFLAVPVSFLLLIPTFVFFLMVVIAPAHALPPFNLFYVASLSM